jgi:hypothetical protein
MVVKLLKNNKNSLYKNYSLIFWFIISLKKIFEFTIFSHFIKKFKSTSLGQIFIENLVYLTREKDILLSLNKEQKAELENLSKFLKTIQ